jgi:hypothetical protein
MPRIIGETIPERMCFTFTPQNRKDVEEAMKNNKFANVSGCINTALRFYFDSKTNPPLTKEWMLSDEGKEYIKNIMRNIGE